MADILVFNALKDVEASLAVKNGLAVKDLAALKTAIETTINNTAYHVTSNKMTLEKLSCLNLISHCMCNYAGSGYYNYANNNSPWQVELNANPALSLYNKLISKSEMISFKGEMEDLTSTVLKNNIAQFIEIYANEYINKSVNKAALRGYWNYSGYANSFKVCSANYCNGEGATCTWTVPTGVSQAKFQLWGAGAGTNPGLCCGGAPFGANGAYSELIVSVTPGQAYTICAGCSCAMNCCYNSYPGCACMSGVTGPNICCLKADGGSSFNCCIMNCASTLLAGSGICHRISNFYCVTSSGACWCSYGEYCFSNSCASCGIIPVYPSCADGNGTWCACGTTTTQVYKDGHKSLHGGGCFDTNHYGYMTRPPIIDSDTCTTYTGGCTCATFTSETCAGGVLGDGWTRHPGQGGAYTHMMGGGTNNYGGKGAGGMVKVSWK